MATMETLLKSVNTKLQMLEFTNESVREALEKRHVPNMERKLKTLQEKIDEIQDLETKIQEAKLEKGENIQDIKEWSGKIESDISNYEASVLELNSVIRDIQKTESERVKQEAEDLASKIKSPEIRGGNEI